MATKPRSSADKNKEKTLSDDPPTLAAQVLDILTEIGTFGDLKISFFRKDCRNLTRRANLLMPFFEEIKEIKDPFPPHISRCFSDLEEALRYAKRLLNSVHNGSKLYLVLKNDKYARRFQRVTVKLERALKCIPYDELNISEEIKEQIQLLHAQTRRAKLELPDPDWQMYEDIGYLASVKNYKDIDPEVLKRCVEKLHLKSVMDLKEESEALYMVVSDSTEADGELLEKLSSALRKLKEFVLAEYPEHQGSDEDSSEGCSDAQIPNDFRCPITLELMEDPIIVATGQTYERTSMQKWFALGHKTCPKTQAVLPHYELVPNIALRSLIAEWCEQHGIDLANRKKSKDTADLKRTVSGNHGHDDRSAIDSLVWKLNSGYQEELREAAGQLRVLAKRSNENRIYMSERGIIRSMINLLCCHDPITQEHAVTTLFNLAIAECLRPEIADAGGIPPIIEVVRSGNLNARANAAGTLLSLVMMTENIIKLAQDGGIPPLIRLLTEGDQTGQRDAASVLFRLCGHQCVKPMAINAGIVGPLMDLVRGQNSRMRESALAILSLVATEESGKVSIVGAAAIPVLLRLLHSGSPREKENSVGILLELCSYSPDYLKEALRLRICDALLPLLDSDRERTKRRAKSLLDHIKRHELPC